MVGKLLLERADGLVLIMGTLMAGVVTFSTVEAEVVLEAGTAETLAANVVVFFVQGAVTVLIVGVAVVISSVVAPITVVSVLVTPVSLSCALFSSLQTLPTLFLPLICDPSGVDSGTVDWTAGVSLAASDGAAVAPAVSARLNANVCKT